MRRNISPRPDVLRPSLGGGRRMPLNRVLGSCSRAGVLAAIHRRAWRGMLSLLVALSLIQLQGGEPPDQSQVSWVVISLSEDLCADGGNNISPVAASDIDGAGSVPALTRVWQAAGLNASEAVRRPGFSHLDTRGPPATSPNLRPCRG